MGQDHKKKPNLYLILCILFVVCALVCVGIWVKSLIDRQKYEDLYQDMVTKMPISQETDESNSQASAGTSESNDPNKGSEGSLETETGESTEETSSEPVDPFEKSVADIESEGIPVPELVVDLEELRETVNKDIYAWIYVPGTKVNYPVLQHPTNDTYYLDYNLDGKKGYPGCIYTEKKYNGKDFQDANTVLYGHNMKNGTMFGSLHKYEDEDFFYENRYIYVYLDDKLLAYKIFAAYEYSNEHLLANNDFEDAYSFCRFFLMAKNRRSMHSIFDEEIRLTGEEHVITLSTCINGKPNNRYLVQGVLINEG